MELAKAVVSTGTDAFVVAGVVWPYVAQAREMKRTGNVESFSRQTSFILLVSAVLRVLYYISLPTKQKFGLPLLFQAIATICTQMWLMHTLVELGASLKNRPSATGASLAPRRIGQERSLLGGDWRSLWAWEDTVSYLLFAMTLFTGGFLVSSSLHTRPWYPPALGAAALGIEALLPLPQIAQNIRRRSTEGLSPFLVGAWLAGDAFKSAYAFLRSEPLPFLACGLYQLTADVVLAAQMVLIYPPRHGSSTSQDKHEDVHRPEMYPSAPGYEGHVHGGLVGGAVHRWANHAAGETAEELGRAQSVLQHEGMGLRARGSATSS